jgi:hypothetical protein
MATSLIARLCESHRGHQNRSGCRRLMGASSNRCGMMLP